MDTITKKNVVFVILHYNEINVTRLAIEHILNLDNYQDCHIVVVDNCSPDKSGFQLLEDYADNPFVTVLQTPQNLGFAKGNNFGYSYSKKIFSPNIVVVMNNDVMIEQKDFMTILYNTPALIDYEVLLPIIINKEGVNQNPFREKGLSTSKIVFDFLNFLLLYVLYSIPIFNKWWMQGRKKNGKTTINRKSEEGTMKVPHGACVIFTKKWIENENNAFVPDTFLYGEEDLLFEYILSKGYKTYYTKALSVHHLEDVSTNTVLHNQLAKNKFLLKNLLFSHKLLLKLRLNRIIRHEYD